jgi:hypothetical protein
MSLRRRIVVYCYVAIAVVLVMMAVFAIFLPRRFYTFPTRNTGWAGITPASTTLVQARVLLEAKYGSDKIRIGTNAIAWNDEQDIDGSSNGLVVSDDKGTVTLVEIMFLTNRVHMADLIGQIGDPTYVWIITGVEVAPKCAGLSITYPNVGLNVQLGPPIHTGSSFAAVDPARSIYSVDLLPLEQARQWNPIDMKKLKWQGYIDYCKLIN